MIRMMIQFFGCEVEGMMYLCDMNSFRGDDPNIDLEFKIPAVLMDAICYSFACLSDEELCKKLLTASYYDSSFLESVYPEYPGICYETEISSNTVDRVSVNLHYSADCISLYRLDVNMKFKNRYLFKMNFNLDDEQSNTMSSSFSNRFVCFFMMLDIPVGSVSVYGDNERIPFRIDSLETYIPDILDELNSDCISGMLDQGICLDVFNAFIDKIGMDRFIECCHEKDYSELLMVALNLRQGKDESKPELHL